MELGNPLILYLGLGLTLVLLIFLILFRPKNKGYKSGKKIVRNTGLVSDSYFKRKMLEYKVMSVLIMAACIAGVVVASVMSARVYRTEEVNKERYNRDIILCMDISGSVDKLNSKLIYEIKDLVKDLDGERVGIVIFNTSPVLAVPLTTDYEYLQEEIDKMAKGLKYLASNDFYYYDEEEVMMLNYLISGTQLDCETRGSSLIGDGLAAAAYDFSKDDDRTKLIIFTTDNELAGEPLVTLSEAADICVKKDIKVYGIGTKEMGSFEMMEMKQAMLKTGGKFYLEESAGTFKQIVEDINKESTSLINIETEILEIDLVKIPFVILLAATSVFIIFTKVTKR